MLKWRAEITDVEMDELRDTVKNGDRFSISFLTWLLDEFHAVHVPNVCTSCGEHPVPGTTLTKDGVCVVCIDNEATDEPCF